MKFYGVRGVNHPQFLEGRTFHIGWDGSHGSSPKHFLMSPAPGPPIRRRYKSLKFYCKCTYGVYKVVKFYRFWLYCTAMSYFSFDKTFIKFIVYVRGKFITLSVDMGIFLGGRRNAPFLFRLMVFLMKLSQNKIKFHN